MENKFYTTQEVIKLLSEFFYEGMTYEEFSNKKGWNLIPRNTSPSEYLHMKIKAKNLKL